MGFMAITRDPPWITNPPFVTSDALASQGWGLYTVSNGMYNPGAGSAQTLIMSTQGQWQVTSTQLAPPQVRAYPAVTYNVGWRLADRNSILVSWSESNPGAAYTGETAFDLWLGGLPASPTATLTEVMIWTNTYGAVPAGSVIQSSVPIEGYLWDLYKSTTLHTWPYYAFLCHSNFNAARNFDLMPFFSYMITQGYITSQYIMNQVDFGWEIILASAGVFTMNDYSLLVT